MKRPDGSLISYFSNRVKKEGGINLAQGTPGFPPPKELLSQLKQDAENKKLHQYAPGIGNFKLLELIRQRFTSIPSQHVSGVDLNQLLIVQGATEGIFLTFFYLTTILKRPYAALSFDPVYESYPELSRMLGVPFVYGQLEDDLSLNFQQFEKEVVAHNVKIVLMASPGNPLGKVWSKAEMDIMVSLSRKHGFYILFDAVYKDIYFEDQPFNPLQYQYEKLFYIDSFSKTLSITGWRIGYIVTPADHMVKIRSIHDYTGLCAPSVLQESIAAYLQASDFGKAYVQDIKQKCRASYETVNQAIIELGFEPAAISGGYFLWARLPENMVAGLEFAVQLFEKTKIGVVPGENFSPSKTRYIRVNIAHPMEVIREAIKGLREFFETVKS